MTFLLVLLVILGLLGGVHWYLWRRIVRDTTVPGGAGRRIGTAAAVLLPLTTFAALVSGRAGAPFAVEQALAWPGYLWLAAVLYLTLALLVGEAVRPLLHRLLRSREDAARPGAGTSGPAAGAAAGAAVGAASEPPPEAVSVAARAGAAEPVGPAGSGGPAGPAPRAARSGVVPAAEGRPGPEGPAAPAPPAPHAPSRRLFVARTVAAAASAAALGTVGYGTLDVLNGPSVKRITVPLAKLPRSAHGYRIAVVSDIHIGPVLGRAHTRRIVEAINRTRPDLVAVVGDLVDGDVADLGRAAEPLAGLRSRDGSFFVTGNHEYFSGAAQWVDFVRDLGVHPLENARVELPGFDLAGVNDPAAEREGTAGEGPDFGRALGDRDPARASVLLAHQPVVIHEAVEHGVGLQLSGHTHGGQLWPGEYLAALANPTVAGLERYGDTQLYVTRGAGAWGPPVRVGAESDITVVTLASPAA
ncbi:metallophosphoesterase [Streptomyces sp. F63]|uniref:metallophosphoesterase n=1 Tax=Streptomyces sp. F63 TaxID=2824887 RepID=UPI001B390E20|nr:metallophosphoesterase [Streptomyces sp. F63]MBQ0986115.1 metallophosphoesterase [Streptomyces sp. F63]